MNETIWEYFRDESFLFPLIFTAKVIAVTTLLHIVFGVLLGKYLSRKSSPLRSVVDLLVTLPMVFPPIALGFLLLLILGKAGPLGTLLNRFLGVQVIFTMWGVIIAAFVAGLPLIVKPVQAAIQGSARGLMEASYTLGQVRMADIFPRGAAEHQTQHCQRPVSLLWQIPGRSGADAHAGGQHRGKDQHALFGNL